VAQYLIEHGLKDKAARHLDCARKGYLMRCETGHEFYSAFHCDLRYCAICSPRQFARLVEKHSPVLEFVAQQKRPGFRLRSITFTSENLGTLTRDQIREFNDQVKQTLHALTKKAKGWGEIWVDEVGFNNTNLHAHGLFYGPYIDHKRLAAVWRRISGHKIVWIKKAKGDGQQALLYALKYVSKAPTDDPAMIGLLEVAFHKARRVHAVGSFYNFGKNHSPNDESEEGQERNDGTDCRQCPKCGSTLRIIREKRDVKELERNGISRWKHSRGSQGWLGSGSGGLPTQSDCNTAIDNVHTPYASSRA
jgi:hypothetical protein